MKEKSRGRNDFLSLQLLIMSGIAGETFKSIIRAGRLVLIKRQTTWPPSLLLVVFRIGKRCTKRGLLFRGKGYFGVSLFSGWIRRWRADDEVVVVGTRENTNPAGLIYELLLSTLHSLFYMHVIGTSQFGLWNANTRMEYSDLIIGTIARKILINNRKSYFYTNILHIFVTKLVASINSHAHNRRRMSVVWLIRFVYFRSGFLNSKNSIYGLPMFFELVLSKTRMLNLRAYQHIYYTHHT